MGERGNISGASSMRILLIEDDQVIADFIQKGMKEAGFTIDHMNDGSVGLHAALTQDYDIGILDLMLPSLDGLSILDRLRQEKKNLPIIILSAKRTVDDRITGLRHGGDDYLGASRVSSSEGPTCGRTYESFVS
jgi:two-component system OmpR family response regulator